MKDRQTIGKEGERLAAEFLQKKGFSIEAQNYRFKKAEIDIIAKREDWLLFIEVKARSSSAFGDPEDAVDSPKISHIYDAAEEYIFQQNWQGHVRFDVIAIKFGREIQIEHFEDAMS